MATLNPYLNFNGKAEEAFRFYQSAFGGEFTTLMRFKDTGESGKLSEADQNKIMHIALPIGNGSFLMASDVPESMGIKVNQGNNFAISISADTKSEADHLFTKLSKDGTVEMPMQETFWGSYFGMFTDKFGIKWMVGFDKKPE